MSQEDPSKISDATLATCTDLFIQPHFDDIALSCGGTVAQLADRGVAPVIVTLFSATPPPDAPISELMQSMHASWGAASTAEAWKLRRAEDLAAVKILGAVPYWFEEVDAGYREYEGKNILTGVLAASDTPLIARIHQRLVDTWKATRRAKVYLPLAIGLHVDHMLCFKAGAALRAAGAELRFYEDFPYLVKTEWTSRRFAMLPGAEHAEVVDVTAEIPRRNSAIRAYTTQVARLFRADGPMPGPFEQLVEKHATTVLDKPGRLGERFWHVPAI